MTTKSTNETTPIPIIQNNTILPSFMIDLAQFGQLNVSLIEQINRLNMLLRLFELLQPLSLKDEKTNALALNLVHHALKMFSSSAEKKSIISHLVKISSQNNDEIDVLSKKLQTVFLKKDSSQRIDESADPILNETHVDGEEKQLEKSFFTVHKNPKLGSSTTHSFELITKESNDLKQTSNPLLQDPKSIPISSLPPFLKKGSFSTNEKMSNSGTSSLLREPIQEVKKEDFPKTSSRGSVDITTNKTPDKNTLDSKVSPFLQSISLRTNVENTLSFSFPQPVTESKVTVRSSHEWQSSVLTEAKIIPIAFPFAATFPSSVIYSSFKRKKDLKKQESKEEQDQLEEFW